MLNKNNYIIFFLIASFTYIYLWPAKEANTKGLFVFNNIAISEVPHVINFSGSQVFQTSLAHYKKNEKIPLTIEDYNVIKSMNEGKRAMVKNIGNKMFTKRIILTKRINRQDTATEEFKKIETILKKYE